MDSRNDPFPSSLPGIDSPQIFDSDMAGSVQDGGIEFFNSAFPQDSPGRLFGADMTNSPYQSPMPVKHNNGKAEPRSSTNADGFAASPESSLQDSSSDSSGRHKRKTSTNSSRSGFAGPDIAMADTQPGGWTVDKMVANRDTTFDYPRSGISADVNYEYSNRAMENDFDFDSAASSPSPNLNSVNYSQTGPRHITIPYRVSPTASASLLPHGRPPMGTRDTSPLSAMVTSEIQPPALQHSQSSPSSSNEEYINGAMLNGMEQLSTWPFDNLPLNRGVPGHVSPLNVQSIPMSRPVASTQGFSGSQYVRAMTYTLSLHPTPQKSRVETQIPIKMTLFPMPPGVTKLHLPTHTISKPKLLVKPTPSRSPDMLELYTMLVCTSAMQDPVKMRRAFARAAQPLGLKKEDSYQSSSGESALAADDENKPLNGGEVNICPGCITRERKRAARKKSKKPEEEEPWQQDEAKRIIVFNTSEVKDWQHPSATTPGPAGTDAKAHNPTGSYDAASHILPDNAMQVEIPMRIACYCRHQNEKLGFQVIFTVKDHQENLIAQAMTNPIVITDDHKTHAPSTVVPPPGSLFVDSIPLSGAGVFAREPLENYGPAPFRNAHSTTDLQSLQQQHFNPQIPRQAMSPFAVPPHSSQTTSTTLTPRSRSRQASPSTQAGPLHKKRKASGSGKVPDGLTMTRLQTSQGSNGPNQSWTTHTPSNGTVSAGASPYTSNYPSFVGSQDRSYGGPGTSAPGPVHTDPSTPNSNENGFFTPANRSQSMDNLSAVQQMFSAPSSARPSRVPSPVTVPNNANATHPGHAQAVMNSLYGLPSSLNPQRPPTIHKLIPGEGTKAGGIEVTCLGSGFCQGLEVMFGDSLATTTTYWGETSLVCLLPPALHAGLVPVTFKHYYHQQLQMPRYHSPPLPKQQVYFKYVDDDEQELLRHALALVHQKMTGRVEDAGEIARRIVNAQPTGPGSWNGSSSQGSDQQRHTAAIQARLAVSPDLEAALLKCLDLIDLDDSPYQARLDLRRANGQSILHISASLGYHRLLAGLLARGANPDLRDLNGMSPMHMASLNGHSQIVRRLRLAGGDPTLRSLSGFTPADMASSQDVLDAVRALHHHSRSRSAGASALPYQSRGSSTTSLRSLWEAPSVFESTDLESPVPKHRRDDASDGEGASGSQAKAMVAPAHQLWARSRRNSAAIDQVLMVEHTPVQLTGATGLLSPAIAMAAWRDQLAVQIQHFQHSVNWTLPNLQIPTLPPMPNLPDYQTYPMVRRISSLVPQRASRPGTSSSGNRDVKESDYRWWDILTGTASSPPAYEEIYPESDLRDLEKKRASAARATTDALLDHKCATNFDQVDAESSFVVGTMADREILPTKEQQGQSTSDHARKVKRLRSDRKLFFIWIPLLTLVMMAMLKDRVPEMWQVACKAATYIHERYNERVFGVL